MSVFPTTNTKSHLEKTCFFDEAVDVARYDLVKYPAFEKLTLKQLGFFWRETEVDLSKDSKDFKGFSEHEKHIFTSNLKRQIILDSVQGRAPAIAFSPICSIPELETWIQTWTFFETIHSRAYTHIIRNIYPDPSKVFNEITQLTDIVDCAKDISKYYDDLIMFNNSVADRGYIDNQSRYEHKRYLWLCLNAVNFLEGIRFYVSFACSWNFAEQKKMEGNAKIIKFIARDENIHLGSTQQMLKILPKDDPDFAKLKVECEAEVLQIVTDVVNQEKAWAKYLMKDGSMIGLNEAILCDFVDERADKCLRNLGYAPKFGNKSGTLPWTQKWIAGSDVQVAPQETQITSYIVGGVKNDIQENAFSKFTL